MGESGGVVDEHSTGTILRIGGRSRHGFEALPGRRTPKSLQKIRDVTVVFLWGVIAVATRRHFGSVRKLPSGHWQVSYWHEAVRHLAPYTFATKADAQAFLSGVEADIKRGVWMDPSAGRVTLAEWADIWLTGRTDLRPVTRAKYRHMLDRHVLPVLGHHELSKLRPSVVRAWYMEMKKRFVTTADDAYRMLRAILTTAMTDEMISKNPCQVKGPDKPDRTSAGGLGR